MYEILHNVPFGNHSRAARSGSLDGCSTYTVPVPEGERSRGNQPNHSCLSLREWGIAKSMLHPIGHWFACFFPPLSL